MIHAGPKSLAARLLAVAFLAVAAAAQSSELDQVFVKGKGEGEVAVTSARVDKNDLAQVSFSTADKSLSVDSTLVVRIVWGDAPVTFREACAALERRDFARAAAKFRAASTDASARNVVKVAARLSVARTLLAWGASEPELFGEAASIAHAFVANFPTNREVPQARMLEARATWLGGNAADAAVLFRLLYGELRGDTPTVGYDRALCLDAGLCAARASLDAKDSIIAREIYRGLAAQTARLAGDAPANSAARRALQAILDEASLGDAFAALADGATEPALAAFQARFDGPDANAAESRRLGVYLGLGEALLAAGKPREASLHLARVCAFDDTLDRDRTARATLDLALCLARLPDGNGRSQARPRLEALIADLGDTPSAVRARATLAELGR
jgi:hypothetical protein